MRAQIMLGALALVILCWVSASPANAETGMVSYWKLDEDSGTTASDSVGTNDGTLVKGVDGLGLQWTSGQVGGALDFDGLDDYVDIPSTPDLRVVGSFSLEAWVYPRDLVSSEQILIAHVAEGAWGFQLAMARQGLIFIFYDGRSWAVWGSVQAPISVLSLDAWNHVVATYSESGGLITAKMYVNAVEVGTFVVNGGFTGSDSIKWGNGPWLFYLGSNLHGSWARREFDGILDEIALYNIALSYEEIQQRYQNDQNQSPMADAGEDQEVNCAPAEGVEVTLDGSGSSDPDDDDLSYSWSEEGSEIATGVSPTVILAPGTYTITLTVDDGNGGADTDEVVITVNADTEPPVITLVGDNPQTIECPDAYVELGATAADNCDGDLSGLILIDATAVDISVLGSYDVTYDVSDTVGNPATQVTRVVTVVDTTAPEIELELLTDILWPPNHKLVKVAYIWAMDICDAEFELGVVVTSNEPINSLGDGNTDPDWVWDADTGELYLRAERSGGGYGRVYTITATATDDSGNAATATAEVIVPHDQGKGKK